MRLPSPRSAFQNGSFFSESEKRDTMMGRRATRRNHRSAVDRTCCLTQNRMLSVTDWLRESCSRIARPRTCPQNSQKVGRCHEMQQDPTAAFEVVCRTVEQPSCCVRSFRRPGRFPLGQENCPAVNRPSPRDLCCPGATENRSAGVRDGTGRGQRVADLLSVARGR